MRETTLPIMNVHASVIIALPSGVVLAVTLSNYMRASHIPLPNPGFAKDFYKDLFTLLISLQEDQLLALLYYLRFIRIRRLQILR